MLEKLIPCFQSWTEFGGFCLTCLCLLDNGVCQLSLKDVAKMLRIKKGNQSCFFFFFPVASLIFLAPV